MKVALTVIVLIAAATGNYDRAKPDRGGDVALAAKAPTPVRKASTALAKYEPVSGCYLGAYIELDPLLKRTYIDQNGRVRKLPDEFEQKVGKKHAMYFFYLGYSSNLPLDWVKKLALSDRFVHIALEPNSGLNKVQDNAYLRKLAKDMRASGAKIFLRFASEMNGPWVAYNSNPRLYKQKFKLVTRVMREEAPNVAMVWCPYCTPKRPIPEYYPGDDWVDWVGVNIYNVTYFNQDPKMPAHNVRPVDLLEYVYKTFSSRKPIMIGEYASTCYSALEGKPIPQFSIRNITELYRQLQTHFPRVKAINYFNSNNLYLKHRKNNDYSVTSYPEVLEAYQKAITPDYFLSNPDKVSYIEP